MRSRTLTTAMVSLAGLIYAGCGGNSDMNTLNPIIGPVVSHYYVVDSGNNRLARFDAFNVTPAFLSYGTAGSGDQQFNAPTSVAFATGDNSTVLAYVVDTGNNRIVRVTFDSTFHETAFTTLGTLGSGANQFSAPTGIDYRGGHIYVADAGNHRIVRFDDITGANWTAFGTEGNGVGQFEDPYSIRVDEAGRIYVSDRVLNRVVRISGISGSGFVAYNAGNTGTPLNAPAGLDVDNNHRIYVADSGNNRIVAFDDLTGKNFTAVTAGSLNDPESVQVVGQGQILVADRGNNRIVRYLGLTDLAPSVFGAMGSGSAQFNAPTEVRGF